VKRIFRLALGIVLVILGIAGSLLPIIPGFVFLIPGLVILSDFFPPVRRLVEWAKRKATESGMTGGAKRPPNPE